MRWIAIILTVFTLVACKKDVTEQQLLSNPDLLRSEVYQCEQVQNQDEPTPRCFLVIKSAKKFMKLVEEQQAQPELFGNSVLKMQYLHVESCAQAKQDKHKLMTLRAANAPKEKVSEAAAQHKATAHICDDAQTKVDQMMAVLQLGTPD